MKKTSSTPRVIYEHTGGAPRRNDSGIQSVQKRTLQDNRKPRNEAKYRRKNGI